MAELCQSLINPKTTASIASQRGRWWPLLSGHRHESYQLDAQIFIPDPLSKEAAKNLDSKPPPGGICAKNTSHFSVYPTGCAECIRLGIVTIDYSRCWARYRTDCDRGMSKEHLISKSLFDDLPVYVSGFNWCMGEEKCVGINSLQRKFLCEKHNNDLSGADAAAIQAIDAFETGGSELLLNGVLLERWLVKLP